jgi:hypothetical protein
MMQRRAIALTSALLLSHTAALPTIAFTVCLRV